MKDALDSLSDLNYPSEDFEIIVVDNNSSDDTELVSRDYINNHVNCFYYKEANLGLHNARHCGLKKSKGEILSFIDDDVLVEPTWLDGIAMGFSQGSDVVLVGGNAHPKFEADLPEWVELLWKINLDGKYLSEYSLLEMGDEIKEISPHMVFGCNFSIRKATLVALGGFHPDGFPSEDLRFRGDGESYLSNEIQKSNGKAFFIPEASLYHRVDESRLTVDYLKKRSYMQGISYSYSLIREKKYLGLYNKLNIGMELFYGKCRAKLIRTEPFRSMQQAFFRGFSFHYNQAKSDANLLNWILKNDYLD